MSNSIYRNGMMSLAEQYKQIFYNSEDVDGYFKMVSNNECVLLCFVEMYGILVKENRLARIEDLEENAKKELWAEARRIAGDGKLKEHYIRLSKALHFLGSLIQE